MFRAILIALLGLSWPAWIYAQNTAIRKGSPEADQAMRRLEEFQEGERKQRESDPAYRKMVYTSGTGKKKQEEDLQCKLITVRDQYAYVQLINGTRARYLLKGFDKPDQTWMQEEVARRKQDRQDRIAGLKQDIKDLELKAKEQGQRVEDIYPKELRELRRKLDAANSEERNENDIANGIKQDELQARLKGK